MRIPFPERIPLGYTTCFALVLLLLQLATRSDLVFSLCCFFFIVIAGVAFNVAGGFTRPSGSYVFFFAFLTAILGLAAKVVFGEPAQSNLLVPLATIETYLGGISAMLVAVYLSRRFVRRKGLLQDLVSDSNMHAGAVGCLVAGLAFIVIGPVFQASRTETVFTAFFRASNQLNRFLEMAIVLGVTYQVRNSGGRSSLNLTVLLAWAGLFFQGVCLGYSKQALFSPFVCWLAAAAVLRYRFRPTQAIAGLVFFLFCYVYMVPYCQYGRIFRNEDNTFQQNVATSAGLLANLPEIRRINKDYDDNIEENSAAAELNYFKSSHGLFDRLQMLSIDDSLHVVTDQRGPLGLQVVWSYAANAVPRVIWKNKPDIVSANIYGHELGLLAPEDDSTSISVSPIGEAYRIAKWAGILIVAPIVWFVLFVVVDSVCGDIRRSPWGILVLATFAHGANEGGISLPFYMVTFGLVGILFVAFTTAYIFPLLAAFVTPPKRKRFVPFRANATMPR